MGSAVRRFSSTIAIRVAIPAIWLGFTAMVMAITWASYAVQGRQTNVRVLFIQYAGLAWWSVITYLVIYLVRRWPVTRRAPGRATVIHVASGLAVVVGVVALEYATGHAFGAETVYLGLFTYKAYIYFLIYWLIAGATAAYDNYAHYQASQLVTSRLEGQLAQSELHALKMQLHPHFLFNTHHAIIALMLNGENAAAIRMLTRLSDLLRLTLDGSQQQFMPLREELTALELYLGIQKERYRERLHTTLEIAENARDAEVPYLLLQPLVENAFKHGIDRLSDNGRIEIKAWRHDRSLHLSVCDNGPGFPASIPHFKTSGVGLRNTRARLRGLYGEAHTLELDHREGVGTEVRISLPYKLSTFTTGKAIA